MSAIRPAHEVALYHRDRATSPLLREYWQRVYEATYPRTTGISTQTPGGTK